MLSNQVKRRIAANKQKRKIPMWKREMRAFFISQLPPAQSLLSAKHLVVDVMKSGEKVLREEVKNLRAEELFKNMRTWTRRDWQAFIRSGDADYASYLGRRSLYRSWMYSREAAKKLAQMPYDPRLAERRKLIEGLTQEQINKAYRRPRLDLPSCKCGAMVGAINVGVTCKSCNTMVRVPKVRDAEGEYLHTYGRLPMPVSPELRTVIDSTLQERPPTPLERNQIEIIQHALKNPDIKWATAFKPKKQGE